MTRRERLTETLRGKSVDRPAVSFYELNGVDEDPYDQSPFNIYSHPSWRPLIELAREKTDRIVIRGIIFDGFLPDPLEQVSRIETYLKDGSLYTDKTLEAGGRILTSRTRRDKDINTVWTEEPLLKGIEDVEALLTISDQNFEREPNIKTVLETEEILGASGIAMIDTPDPLCLAASLFGLADYTEIAFRERSLFHRLLEMMESILLPRVEFVGSALPGRLWRIYGPEYASSPFLAPRYFREYVVRYDTRIIHIIKASGGIARIHCHGKLKGILDDIVSMGSEGLDPIEPPPQGDVELGYVRKRYGRDLILFGNLEVSDIENLPTSKFERKVRTALEQGTSGEGRGFVLMPSASPYGRELSRLALGNYERMIELVESF
jgi:hypothetical protein